MGEELVINPEDLAGLTDQEIIKLLDTTWPWPLDSVQTWFENFYNTVLSYFWTVVGWIYNRVKPLIDTVWSWLSSWSQWVVSSITSWFNTVYYWIQGIIAPIVASVQSVVSTVWSWLASQVSWLLSNIQPLFSQVWGWLQSGFNSLTQSIAGWFNSLYTTLSQFASSIAQRVGEINAWFSDEFIDPFLDWLLQFPGKFWAAAKEWWHGYVEELVKEVKDPTSPLWITWYALIGIALIAVIGMATPIGAAVIGAVRWLGGIILATAPSVLGWFGNLWFYIQYYFLTWTPAIGLFFRSLLPRIMGWLAGHWVGLAVPATILGLEATGIMNKLVRKFVTPLFVKMFDWAEALGPVSPTSGKSVIEPLTGMIEITIGGLAAMTLAGETLGIWKHIGMGHISAMVYDLTNYKVLTAAFVGVLAGIYIKTPLTYYYNKIARPNIPDERTLTRLAGEYAITRAEFDEGMAYQGYDNEWIPKLFELADRPLTPRLFTQIASVGILDDELIDRELKNAGYNEKTIPYLKTWLKRQAEGDLKTLMTSLPITRFKEGFDTEDDLKNNLAALGVDDSVMPKYVFAARLSYLYDYQTDLKTYYIDAYHRRDIEEPELRSNLVSVGINPDRLDLIVSQQKIKRLAAAKVAAPEELSIQLDTIRDRRVKLLIARDQEIEQLIAMGKELPYAIAIADNDDVKIAEKAVVVAPAPVLFYETEEGKIRVDTIRRLRRQRQISPEQELATLVELEIPQTMAQAIVDNDELRLRKETAQE